MQLSLIDMRPICPACKQVTDLLGQWSPGDSVFICRDCNARHSAPDVFVPHDNSKGVGLDQSMTLAANAGRAEYHKWINILSDLNRGCVYTFDDVSDGGYLPCHPVMDEQCWANCKLCIRRARNISKGGRYGRMGQLLPVTYSFPICDRCGCVHDHRYEHFAGTQAYCQECDDKNTVESFWRLQGIFDGDDDEAVMDRLHRVYPDLFVRGVLPDYWYQLRIQTIRV